MASVSAETLKSFLGATLYTMTCYQLYQTRQLGHRPLNNLLLILYTLLSWYLAFDKLSWFNQDDLKLNHLSELDEL